MVTSHTDVFTRMEFCTSLTNNDATCLPFATALGENIPVFIYP
jgi:hypothetical protein